MQRTLVNLDPEDKAWLDREARIRNVPMTELVRQAVRGYRVREESRGSSGLQSVLKATASIWRSGDGLEYQQRLRNEWADRE